MCCLAFGHALCCGYLSEALELCSQGYHGPTRKGPPVGVSASTLGSWKLLSLSTSKCCIAGVFWFGWLFFSSSSSPLNLLIPQLLSLVFGKRFKEPHAGSWGSYPVQLPLSGNLPFSLPLGVSSTQRDQSFLFGLQFPVLGFQRTLGKQAACRPCWACLTRLRAFRECTRARPEDGCVRCVVRLYRFLQR